MTKCHRLSGLNSRNLFSRISGFWKSKIKVSAGMRFSETSPLDLQLTALLADFFFFDLDHFKSQHWICYNIASVLGFWFFGQEACGILALWAGIKPAPAYVGRLRLNRWPTREVLCSFFTGSSLCVCTSGVSSSSHQGTGPIALGPCPSGLI